MILIITDAFDAHSDAVASHLDAKGQAYFRFDINKERLLESKITIQNLDCKVSQGSSSFSSNQISCVWARRLSVSLDVEDSNDNDQGFRMWKAEWNRCLFGLYSIIKNVSWLNPISASSLIDNKFYQANLAKECGFRIPSIMTSNCKQDLTDFARQHGHVALKFLSQEVYKQNDGTIKGLYVNKITEDDLTVFGTKAENPISLQIYVDKRFEVRLTYVDGDYFACRIDSQASIRASVDWRRYDIANTPHSRIEPPDHIRNCIRVFMQEAGLIYGAFDFVVDCEGCWWYLEVNSAGQWLWIEDLAQLPISAAVAECLIRKSSGAK